MDHKTVDSDLARKFFNSKNHARNDKNISHILILFLCHLSVISLTKSNTKWDSKRKLENPRVQTGKGTGSRVQILWVIFRSGLYTVKYKGYSEGVVAKRSVQSCNLQRSTAKLFSCL